MSLFGSREKTQLDETIEQVEREIQINVGDPKQVAKLTKQLSALYTLRDKHRRKGVSPDTLLIVAGNLAGIIIVVGYERGHVVATRALSQIIKPR
jgi:hypothetical protein